MNMDLQSVKCVYDYACSLKKIKKIAKMLRGMVREWPV